MHFICRILIVAIGLSAVTVQASSLFRFRRDATTTSTTPVTLGAVSSQQISWWKIANCIKQKLGVHQVTNRNVRCAAREMFSVFRVQARTNCKNCDLYFFCTANSNVHSKCSGHRAVEAAEAISDCDDIRNANVAEEINEASEFGRGGGNCAKMYLCATGCKFAQNNSTCSAVCH